MRELDRGVGIHLLQLHMGNKPPLLLLPRAGSVSGSSHLCGVLNPQLLWERGAGFSAHHGMGWSCPSQCSGPRWFTPATAPQQAAHSLGPRHGFKGCFCVTGWA